MVSGTGGKRVVQVPDAGAGEPVDDADAEFLSRASRVLQLFGRPFVDASRIAVTPNVVRQDCLMPRSRWDPEPPGRPGGH